MSRPAPSIPPLLEATGTLRERALARAPQAEWGLAHQGAQVLLGTDQSTGWLVRRAGRRLVALGMPLGPAAFGDLARTASAQGLSPLIYKCDAATACAARRQGWQVLRLGHEAVLDLRTWTADRPACRQLRRKLRAVSKVLRIEEARHLPLDQMEEVSRDWIARSGHERGFSMGRLDPRPHTAPARAPGLGRRGAGRIRELPCQCLGMDPGSHAPCRRGPERDDAPPRS